MYQAEPPGNKNDELQRTREEPMLLRQKLRAMLTMAECFFFFLNYA